MLLDPVEQDPSKKGAWKGAPDFKNYQIGLGSDRASRIGRPARGLRSFDKSQTRALGSLSRMVAGPQRLLLPKLSVLYILKLGSHKKSPKRNLIKLLRCGDSACTSYSLKNNSGIVIYSRICRHPIHQVMKISDLNGVVSRSSDVFPTQPAVPSATLETVCPGATAVSSQSSLHALLGAPVAARVCHWRADSRLSCQRLRDRLRLHRHL